MFFFVVLILPSIALITYNSEYAQELQQHNFKTILTDAKRSLSAGSLVYGQHKNIAVSVWKVFFRGMGGGGSSLLFSYLLSYSSSYHNILCSHVYELWLHFHNPDLSQSSGHLLPHSGCKKGSFGTVYFFNSEKQTIFFVVNVIYVSFY